jgi:hypothetical protein
MWWVGHMVRMGDTRLPRKILFGRLAKARLKGQGRLKQKVAMLYEQNICEMATVKLV